MTADRDIDRETNPADRIARLRIRLPPVNVLRLADLELLARRVEECRGAEVLILAGLPAAFSAGVDVADHAPEADSIERMLRAMRHVLEALVETPAITIAAVSGACLGGGAEIASACDLVVGAEDARIGFPEIRLACFPPGAVALLPLRIGSARAWDWILTGRVVSGREAALAGFVTKSVDPGSVDAAAERLANELAAKSSAAIGAVRSLIRQERHEALARILPRAEAAYLSLAGSPDLAKAVEQFLKKN
ncbi:MAG TPA: enoyl-CoA hydratase/isomerase family protein [Thermoanaerobaculia bacterium]